jgi:hypothetical protein
MINKKYLEENRLNPIPIIAEEIIVEASDNKWWRKLFKEFEEEFLGISENAKHSKIMNPYKRNFLQK